MSYTLYYKMNPAFQSEHEYYYEDVHGKLEPFTHMQFADFIWKEDSSGVRLIKDRFSGCISRLETEDELKEFMWIKLKSQKL